MPLEFCWCDWTEKNEAGGACWQCCHNSCEPCCGDPCNFLDGLYCCLCWWCCSPCQLSKYWASQVEQPCSCINHCIPVCLLLLLAGIGFPCNVPMCIFNMVVRYNSRLEAGVFDNPDSIDKHIGDFFLPCCCLTAPCQFCQQLRTVPSTHWDCCGQLRGAEGFVCILDDWRLIRSPGGKTMN